MFTLNLQDTLPSEYFKTDDEDERYILNFYKQWNEGVTKFEFNTSGSTGIPKKIILRREQMLASALQSIEAFHLRTEDVFLLCLLPQTIAGSMLLLRALLLKSRIAYITPSNTPFENIDAEHPFTVASFVPSQLYSLISNPYDTIKYNRFRKVLIGGAAIPQGIESVLTSLAPETFHTYGMTETVSHIAIRKPGNGNVFQPLNGIYLATDDNNCLRINGAVTNNQWIQTNDIVKLYPNHTFEVLGRKDEVINTGGKKVFPQKVESVLSAYFPNISHFVYALPHDKWGEEVVWIYEGDSIDEVYWQSLKPQLLSQLELHEIPKQKLHLSQFKRTPSGKVDKINTIKLLIS